MKRLAILTLILCCCGVPDPQGEVEPATREPTLPQTKAPEPEIAGGDIDEDIKAADKEEGVRPIDVEEIMEIGVRTHEAEEQLAGMHKVVVFLECIKQSTGRDDIDGAAMARHIKRNTKHARHCKKKVAGMSNEEIAAEANAWIAKDERSK